MRKIPGDGCLVTGESRFPLRFVPAPLSRSGRDKVATGLLLTWISTPAWPSTVARAIKVDCTRRIQESLIFAHAINAGIRPTSRGEDKALLPRAEVDATRWSLQPS